MSSFSEQHRSEQAESKREREQEAREFYEGLKEDLIDRKDEGLALSTLMYRETDYPYTDRPAELVHRGLTVEQITNLVVTATDNPQERFVALNDFAKIFAGKAMSSAASSTTREERIATAFDLKDRATEELVKGYIVIPV